MEKEKKHGCGYMTADDWFEIEDYYTGRKTTMEDIAAIGPEGRKAFRERPSNPYFPKPDLSLYDESLYDGTKIRE